MFSGVRRSLLSPIDAAWLVAFRVLFGLLLAISLERFLAYGWVDEFLVAPRFHFKYWGFGWVEPLAGGAMHALFYGLIVLGLCVSVGFCFRLAAIGLALGFTYLQLIDVSTYLNHYYLASLLAWLLAVSPANRLWSVDAWLRRGLGRAVPTPQVARAWLVLFRVQVAVVYFFAGIAKLQSDWLLDAEPLGIWLGQSTSLPLLGTVLTWPGAAWLFAWCGFFFDLTIVAWLSWSKSRPFAYAVVLSFHLVTRLLFDIGMFPMIMSAAALVFFSPGWPRRLLRLPSLDVAAGGVSVERRAARDALLVLGAMYCLVQVALPLRFLVYPGNVLWHEQGMRFSWRVMVRAKGGAVTFVLRDPETGSTREVEPRQFLTPFQENEMGGQPDLILQGARYLAAQVQRDEGRTMEVRVRARASLNGRRAAPLIDPEVDLGRVTDGLAPYTWVLPAPTERAPHLRPVL